LEFRTGAGATLQWASQWWHPFGIDYPSTAERVSILEEGIHILDILWNKQQTTAAVSFEGKYFKLKGAATLQKNQKRIPRGSLEQDPLTLGLIQDCILLLHHSHIL
jgi:alkanesulfonate monooxygenase SsuD/methylene tetrahydromethanopterin reductase-like flavin-dependent oxidoreductase (luciferase family)